MFYKLCKANKFNGVVAFIATTLFILLLPKISNAQNDANWVFGDSIGVDFRFDPPKISKQNATGPWGIVCSSDDKGNLVAYGDADYVYFSNGQILKKKIPNAMCEYSKGIILKIPNFKNRYFLFKTFNGCKSSINTNSLFNYSIIDFNESTKKYYFEQENIVLDTGFGVFTVIQHKNKIDFWLVNFNNPNTIISYLVDKNGISKKIVNPIKDLSKITKSIYNTYHYQVEPAHAKPIIYSYNWNTYYVKNTSLHAENDLTVEKNEIDNQSGKIISHTLLINHMFTDTQFLSVATLGVSPNDSVIYYQYDKQYSEVKNHKWFFMQLNINNNGIINTLNLIDEKKYYPYLSTMKLASNGQFYFGGVQDRFYEGRIKYPDKTGKGCGLDFIKSPQYTITKYNSPGSGQAYPTVFLPHHKLFLRNENGCDTRGMKFTLDYDTGFFTKFVWYFHTDSLYYDSVIGSPTAYYKFPKSGVYKVRVAATSDAGYTKWRTDLVRYRGRPVAVFSTGNHFVCQGDSAKFSCLSINDTLFGERKENFYWQFGNGAIGRDKNPTYMYPYKGWYDVTLVYSNGYCSDTLTKKQFAEVLETPKAGFNIKYDSKCIPSTLNFKSTATGEINKIVYYFRIRQGLTYDSMVIVDGFKKVYKPGNYLLKQKVIGNSGCMAKDSINIAFHNAFTLLDTPTIKSIESRGNHHLYFNWLPMFGAKYYELYRNNTRIGSLVDSFYEDSLVSDLRVNSYYIVGVDSCLRKTSKSLPIQNIYLKANPKGQEGVFLDWNMAYAFQSNGYVKDTIGKTMINQEIIKFDTSFFSDIRGLNNLYNKCYQVGYFHRLNKSWVSKSNIACSDLPFLFYAPNSFSPNGDGLNDLYEPKSIGIQSYEMKIFNRWGQLVYEGKRWNGQNSMEGDYICIFSIKLADGSMHQEIKKVLLLKN